MADNASKQESFDSERLHLGAVYAKALLGAAAKAGNVEAVVEELESLVADVLDALPRFNALLQTPRLANDIKLQLLEKAFAGRASNELLTFLRVLGRHGRLDCIRAVAQAARALQNEILGKTTVSVKVVEPMSESTLAALEQKLRAAVGGQIALDVQLDDNILGGMVVRVGDTVFDGSLANQLVRLRQNILENTQKRIRDAGDRFILSN